MESPFHNPYAHWIRGLLVEVALFAAFIAGVSGLATLATLLR